MSAPSSLPTRKTPLRGWRRWLFPLLAATLIPTLFLLTGELVLRLAGRGTPTVFFLPAVQGTSGEDLLVTNPRFAWRFFPPEIARNPVVEALPEEKDPNTFRIAVLGGSAALGTPEPAFGLARVLEVLLREAYPEASFEVVNGAMAAINSHVVLPIGREMVERETDLLVIYLGNNEVVGPFGPGTVFGGFQEHLSLLRLGTALKTTVWGQVLASLRTPRGGGDLARWKGLEAFLDNPVTADDPRLATVYRHLEANLRDLLEAARDGGSRVLLSTVAVNLKDSPPFASRHREGWSEAQEGSFAEHLESAEMALASGRFEKALAEAEAAQALDPAYAEAHFVAGRALLALGRATEARPAFLEALELDALRFRADHGINEAIRRAAGPFLGDDLRLLEADEVLSRAPETRDGILGQELFYEHVHFHYLGTYRLAEAVFREITPMIPERLGPGGPPASPETVARTLALTPWDQARMAESIREMTDRPPFTAQLGHGEQQRERRQLTHHLEQWSHGQLDAIRDAYRQAVKDFPESLSLAERHGELLAYLGHPEEAEEVWHRLLARLPEVAQWRTRLGFVLAAQGRFGEALTQLAWAQRLAPGTAAPWVNLASVRQQSGDLPGAEDDLRRALALNPAHEAARLSLASVLVVQKRGDEAEEVLRQALALDPTSAPVQARLAEVLAELDRVTEAEEILDKALAEDPDDPSLANSLGLLLERAGRPREAGEAYRRATEIDPGYALAYFNLGDLFLARGATTAAAEAYRGGLALRPDNLQGRYNLAGALQASGRPQEAARELRILLRRQPDSPGALHSLAFLLATEPGLADPGEAVELAEKATELTEGQAPEILYSLATAYRAAGRREDAVAVAREGRRQALAAGNSPLSGLLDRLLRDLGEAP